MLSIFTCSGQLPHTESGRARMACMDGFGLPVTTVRMVRRFHAAPERVFDAWLIPQTARLWLFATATRPMAAVRMDAREGGRFCFVENGGGVETEYVGEYIELVRPRRLVFTLRLSGITRVTADFVPLRTGCELVVTHARLPPRLAEAIKARWTGVLYGLGLLLDRRAETEVAAADAKRSAVRRLRATAPPATRTWD